MKMYVGNLSFETTENDLQDLFEQHGTVNEVHLMTDRFTAKSRGFAFVTMNDGAQANAAMTGLNGRELNGRTLTVNEARRALVATVVRNVPLPATNAGSAKKLIADAAKVRSKAKSSV
jgi:RNA recognition motif-containing protein